MKRTLPFLLAALLAPALRAESVSGSSRTFLVDTRCRDFVIADVKSDFCSGAYGPGRGTHATFLQGVAANVEFKVSMLGNDIPVERVVANGTSFTGMTFTFNVGTLPVGGQLVVVAHGMVNGEDVESPPFRVNCDIASIPDGINGIRVVSRHDGAIWYMSDELSTLAILDGIEEGMGLLGQEVPFVLKPSFRLLETMDSASGLWKEGTGGGVRLFDLWDGVASLAQLVRTQTIGCIHGVDLELELEGDAVKEWNPSRQAWMRHSCSLGFRVNADASVEIPIPQTLYLVRLKGGIQTDVSAKLGMMADGSLFGTLDWDPVFELYGGVKAGFPGVWAQGTAGGGIALAAEFPSRNGRYISDFGGSFWLDFKWRFIAWGNWQDTESLHLAFPFSFVGGRGKNSPVARKVDSAGKPEWSLIPRDYLEIDSPASAMRTTKAAKATLRSSFATGGYPYPAPTVAVSGGETLVAYLRDDGTRSDANRTEVVFGEAAERVWNDGTADFAPSLGTATSGTAILAWMNAGRVFSSADDFEAQRKAMEIAVAVRNPSTGAWTARNLTADSALDAAPQMAVAPDGTAVVAWLRNATGALFGSAAEPTSLMAARWDGAAWSAPVTVAADVGAILGFDLAWNGTVACLVYVFDGDGDFETTGDLAVSAATWRGGEWGAPVAMAAGLDDVAVPVARFGADGAVMALWSESGVLCERKADGSAAVANADVRWDGAIPGDARAAHGEAGALALVWTETDGEGGLASHTVAMPCDASLGAWGGPVAVSGTDGLLARSTAGAPGADGAFSAAWESLTATTNAEGIVEYGPTTLRSTTLAAGADPAVLAVDFAFATNVVQAGELVPISATVRNFGLAPMTNVMVRFWVCDGELEEDEDARCELHCESGEPCVLDLPGGAAVIVTNLWMAEDFRTNLTFVAQIEIPRDAADRDISNNMAIWRPGAPALALENARCATESATVRLLTATVRNSGLAGALAGTRVSFHRCAPDGAEIGADVIGAVPAGEDNGYDAGITWNMTDVTFTSAWETVWAVIDTGNANADSTSAAPIRVMTSLDTDGDCLLDAEEERLGTNPSKMDTDGDGVGDYDEVYVFFSDPCATELGKQTITTPIPIPYSWLNEFVVDLAFHDGDYEALGNAVSSNGVNKVWECYVSGISPTNAADAFRAVISWKDGAPEISWEPILTPEEAEKRTYRKYGKVKLTDENWTEIDGDEASYNFFKVSVEMK